MEFEQSFAFFFSIGDEESAEQVIAQHMAEYRLLENLIRQFQNELDERHNAEQQAEAQGLFTLC